MQERISKVELEANGVTREFTIEIAERLLKMPNNGGWKLPDSSNLIFEGQNGFTIKRDSGTNQATKKNSGN
jgi:hypothetical protein